MSAPDAYLEEFSDFLRTPIPPKTVQKWKLTVRIGNEMTVHYLETPYDKNYGKMLDAVKELARPILATYTFGNDWTVGYRKVGR